MSPKSKVGGSRGSEERAKRIMQMCKEGARGEVRLSEEVKERECNGAKSATRK